jgi:multidrug efflux pump subunit AcrB
MTQVTGPIIATTLVLAALFVPIAFLGGITGQLYRQFAVTILVTITFSTINALTLSPALCVLMLRPPVMVRGRVFGLFNRGLDAARHGYLRMLASLSRRLAIGSVAMLVVFAGIYGLFRALPTGFVPAEDQGCSSMSNCRMLPRWRGHARRWTG